MRKFHALKIPLEYTDAELCDTIHGLVKINNTPDAYIRITLSRGFGCQGLVMNDNPKSTLLIQVRPHTPYRKELYEKGMSLIISKARRSTSCPIASHKTTNLLTSILLKDEAKRRSADEALILNTDNEVAECTVSNIFMVQNGNVITPSLETNILPGITRKTVLNICKDKKYPVKEERFKAEVLLQADEIFLTNSLMEIMPVASIDDNVTGKCVPGEITSELTNAYNELTYPA